MSYNKGQFPARRQHLLRALRQQADAHDQRAQKEPEHPHGQVHPLPVPLQRPAPRRMRRAVRLLCAQGGFQGRTGRVQKTRDKKEIASRVLREAISCCEAFIPPWDPHRRRDWI